MGPNTGGGSSGIRSLGGRFGQGHPCERLGQELTGKFHRRLWTPTPYSMSGSTMPERSFMLLRCVALFAVFSYSLFAQGILAVGEKKAGKVGFYTVAGERVGEVQVG